MLVFKLERDKVGSLVFHRENMIPNLNHNMAKVILDVWEPMNNYLLQDDSKWHAATSKGEQKE